jgi:RHS repeat-associated protein
LGDLSYTYDDAGRRTSEGGSFARSNLPAALSSTTFDAANRLSNWGGTSLTYDFNGNMNGNGTRSYTWDPKNQLAAITGAATASFQYDAFGRRVSKTVSGVTTKFVYDGMNPVQEQDGTGTPTANLLTGLGVDEYFSRTDATGARSFLTDALGSSIALTDSAGVIQTSYTYDPYGETTAALQANSNAFEYTGRENDGTGLYFYRARYYDPVLKRFISEDPIGLVGASTLTHMSGGIRFLESIPLVSFAFRIVGLGRSAAQLGALQAEQFLGLRPEEYQILLRLRLLERQWAELLGRRRPHQMT